MNSNQKSQIIFLEFFGLFDDCVLWLLQASSFEGEICRLFDNGRGMWKKLNV